MGLLDYTIDWEFVTSGFKIYKFNKLYQNFKMCKNC